MGGLLAVGNSQHRPKCVNWLLPVRGDSQRVPNEAEALGEWVMVAGLPSAFFGLHSIGRLVARTAPHRHRSVCRLHVHDARAFGHAVTITSMPARGANVMAPALRRVHLPAFLTAICHLAACGPRFGVERWAGSGALGCARLWPAVARCLCWLCRLTRFSRHRAAPTTH